jgi:hypothetical protein
MPGEGWMDRHVPGPVEHNRGVSGYGQLARLTLQRAAHGPDLGVKYGLPEG